MSKGFHYLYRIMCDQSGRVLWQKEYAHPPLMNEVYTDSQWASPIGSAWATHSEIWMLTPNASVNVVPYLDIGAYSQILRKSEAAERYYRLTSVVPTS